MTSEKVKNYVNALFAGVPRTNKAAELKEEIMSDMNERYNDYIRDGKSETEAYSLTIANMGDVDAMMRSVLPDEDFKQGAEKSRIRRARNIGIAIALYILSVIFVIGSSLFGTDNAAIIGVIIMLTLIAIATGLIIYTHMSTPLEYRDLDEQKEQELYATRSGRNLKNALSIFWSLATIAYLLVSFLTMRWDITWLIWPVAAVVSGIIKTIWGLASNNE